MSEVNHTALRVSREFMLRQAVLNVAQGEVPVCNPTAYHAACLRFWLRASTNDGTFLPGFVEGFVLREYRRLSQQYREAA